MNRKIPEINTTAKAKKPGLVIAVIPTFNSWNTLKVTIKSLLNQSVPLQRIIVVDNASTDGTAVRLTEKFPQVVVISCLSNTGVVGGRNTGIKNLPDNCDYVLFFDHDMVADKKMVEEMLDTGSRGNEIGIVTPKIYYLSNKKRIWSAGTGINLKTGQILFRGGIDKGQYNSTEEVQVAPAAMLVKRQVLKKIKQFDRKYFATYEDTDFCFRAKNAGFKTVYCPKAVAYHDLPEGRQDESVRLLKRLYWVGRNRILFMRDFGSNFTVFMLFLPVFTVYYLLLAIRYGSPADFLNFVRGTIDGLKGK